MGCIVNKILLLFVFFVSLLIPFSNSYADGINLENYKEFLDNHKNTNYDSIKSMHTQNSYLYYSAPECQPANAQYFNDLKAKFELTEGEVQLLEKNNFVVLSRSKYNSFGNAIQDYWYRDIPLYFTSDALLYAFHKSYDNILKDLEQNYIYEQLNTLLSGLEQVPSANASDSVLIAYKTMNLFIGVARTLLSEDNQYVYSETDEQFKELYNKIIEGVNAQGFGSLKIFPDAESRMYDYSQLKPRGHYEESDLLKRYFKAMMWLGRTELYLIAPDAEIDVPEYSLNIQTAVTYLIADRINNDPQLLSCYNNINDIIKGFVGEQDNVQFNNIIEIANEIGVTNIEQFFTDRRFEDFRNALAQKPYSDQKILSQCLIKSCDGKAIKPASAFMVFGSRFVFDSYIFSNLVYDKVNMRMMPKPMDVLFVLGNNSASEFLEADFGYSDYGKNLASLRYLIDSYGEDFWNSSVYNSWLHSIKALNPPASINHLPVYMQTPAWWQLKMNTQLASWATLRHDNLLYAKQSYTGMPGCDYPTVMVEPIPEFFAEMSNLCTLFRDKLSVLNNDYSESIRSFLLNFAETTDMLKVISQKELAGQILSEDDYSFLKSCYSESQQGCAPSPSGWYFHLFYNSTLNFDEDMQHLIADVHTQPADESGCIVGKVLHVGIGAANTMIVITKDNDGVCKALAGPVFSYYEYITDNFQRLTDTEWKEMFINNTQLARPSFTKVYLADENGNKQGNPEILQYTLGVEAENPILANAEIAISPNPFITSSNIWLRIDNLSSVTDFSVQIFDQNGNLVRDLANESISGGNYVIKWDAKNNFGETVSNGVYLIKAILNGQVFTSKIVKG